jgi:hypothetical protein
MLAENVVQPLLVSTSAVTLAIECVRMILKIDDIVPVRACFSFVEAAEAARAAWRCVLAFCVLSFLVC